MALPVEKGTHFKERTLFFQSDTSVARFDEERAASDNHARPGQRRANAERGRFDEAGSDDRRRTPEGRVGRRRW